MGSRDLEQRIIRTPFGSRGIFSDDPRMMMSGTICRASARVHDTEQYSGADRCPSSSAHHGGIDVERITTEFMKIICAARLLLVLSYGWYRVNEGIPTRVWGDERGRDERGHKHKNNFDHTLQVVDNISAMTENLTCLAKTLSRYWEAPDQAFTKGIGWSFHNHDYIGAKMPYIFKRLKLPTDARLKYAQKLVQHTSVQSTVGLMRGNRFGYPKATFWCRRRYWWPNDTVSESDPTSKNPHKVQVP